jgi:4-hydroxy-4-methyl-2-oxoglutarate aldolase
MEVERVLELAERYRKVGTAAVYSALEAAGAPLNLLALDIRPITPDLVIAGPAFTLKAVRDPRTHHTPDTEFAKFDDYAMFRAMTQGCVIAADPGERYTTGFWGDLMSAASETSGARGIVIDGCARDVRQLRTMPNFPVFSRSTTMSSTERRVLTVDFQIPIGMTGSLASLVTVNPGDWIFGDDDGVVVIPPNFVERILVAAEAAETREEAIRKDFAAGMPVWEVYPKHRRL